MEAPLQTSESRTGLLNWMLFIFVIIVGFLGIVGPSLKAWLDSIPEGVVKDMFAVQYRSAEKAKTILGQLPLPLEVFYKQGTCTGVTSAGQKTTIPVTGVTIDAGTNVLFDVYRDRLYYVMQGYLYYYDVSTQQRIPVMVGGKGISVSADDLLSGVHNDYIAFQSIGGSAATNTIRIYDMKTGQNIRTSLSVGYDGARAYVFSVNDISYHLIVNSKGPSSVPGRAVDARLNSMVMKVYLNEAVSSDFVQPQAGDVKIFDNAIINFFEDIVFTGAESPYFKTVTPIFSLPSNKMSSSFAAYDSFSVRNLFEVDDDHVALEVNEGLIHISLKDRIAQYITEPAEIETMLRDAILLSTDEDDYHNHGNCLESWRTMEDQGYDFSYCLY